MDAPRLKWTKQDPKPGWGETWRASFNPHPENEAMGYGLLAYSEDGQRAEEMRVVGEVRKMWVHTQEALLGVRADLAPSAQPPADSAWQPAESSARERRLADGIRVLQHAAEDDCSGCELCDADTTAFRLAIRADARAVLASPEAPAQLQHVIERHANCQIDRCPICDGGLSVCTVCGRAEAELVPSCPGARVVRR